MIYFSSGLHTTLYTGAECPNPFPKKENVSRPANEYVKISFVSVPKARFFPDGLTFIELTLYGYGIWATG